MRQESQQPLMKLKPCLRLQYQLLQIGGQAAIQGYPIDPIAWIGREIVTISKLDRDLSMPLKS
jgi:hypothetical protein